MTWFLVLTLLAACSLGFVAWKLFRKRLRLTGREAEKARMQFANIWKMQDASRRVLEAENILDGALTSLGFRGSFGEKLKALRHRLPQIESLWQAHKLRNRIAHESGMSLSPAEADRAVRIFERVLLSLMH